MKDKDHDSNPPTPPPKPAYSIQAIGETLALVRQDVKEMKPKIQEARDGVIRLEEWKRTSERRLEEVEKRSLDGHECAQVEVIATLQGQSREASIQFAKQDRAVEDTEKSVGEIKNSRSTLGYFVAGTIVSLALAIGGWIWSMATLSADVAHIRSQQSEVRDEVKNVVSQTKAATVEVRDAAKSVKAAADPYTMECLEKLPRQEQVRVLSDLQRIRLEEQMGVRPPVGGDG